MHTPVPECLPLPPRPPLRVESVGQAAEAARALPPRARERLEALLRDMGERALRDGSGHGADVQVRVDGWCLTLRLERPEARVRVLSLHPATRSEA